jgi:hypothetical protein
MRKLRSWSGYPNSWTTPTPTSRITPRQRTPQWRQRLRPVTVAATRLVKTSVSPRHQQAAALAASDPARLPRPLQRGTPSCRAHPRSRPRPRPARRRTSRPLISRRGQTAPTAAAARRARVPAGPRGRWAWMAACGGARTVRRRRRHSGGRGRWAPRPCATRAG